MDECTSNGNAVDDREVLFCFTLVDVAIGRSNIKLHARYQASGLQHSGKLNLKATTSRCKAEKPLIFFPFIGVPRTDSM